MALIGIKRQFSILQGALKTLFQFAPGDDDHCCDCFV